MSKSQVESQKESAPESPNESQETRRFDSDQIRASAPRPGLVLRQRYRLDSEIGRGAMGIVFRATDLELLRPVAVKILAERIGGGTRAAVGTRERAALLMVIRLKVLGTYEGSDAIGSPEGGRAPERDFIDDMRSRFLREARAAAALNHPHIVAVYDVGEDHGFPFFVMELVDGPNLGQTPPHDLAAGG